MRLKCLKVAGSSPRRGSAVILNFSALFSHINSKAIININSYKTNGNSQGKMKRTNICALKAHSATGLHPSVLTLLDMFATVVKIRKVLLLSQSELKGSGRIFYPQAIRVLNT